MEAQMGSIEGLRQAAQSRQRDCAVMSRAYGTTLATLAPANFILVVGAALLSLAAGASILIENNVVTKVQAGVLALVSSAFTVVHSKLGCEHFQAECKKLRSFYNGIAEEYRNLGTITDIDELRKRLVSLNDQVAAAVKSATVMPFDWATSRHEASKLNS